MELFHSQLEQPGWQDITLEVIDEQIEKSNLQEALSFFM